MHKARFRQYRLGGRMKGYGPGLVGHQLAQGATRDTVWERFLACAMPWLIAFRVMSNSSVFPPSQSLSGARCSICLPSEIKDYVPLFGGHRLYREPYVLVQHHVLQPRC